MDELISIIVPIYKVEDYLHRCVDSILKQTYKNIEVILVDDGSPDRCGNICEEYSKKDNRIIVIHKKNGGLSDARNAGIDIAKGDYISFIDSDDWIHEEYIERLYKLLINTNSDISVCSYVMTSSELINNDFLGEEINVYSNIEALELIYEKSICTQMVIICGKLYKRYLFENIRFPIGKVHEDEFITYKLMYQAKKITLTTARLLYYWQRNDSITGSGFNFRHKIDAISAYEERAEFFSNIELYELSGKTYKLTFFMYLKLNEHIDEFIEESCKNEFLNGFEKFKNKLRKSNQKIFFKVFYEMYFINPSLMNLVYRLYSKIRIIRSKQ